MALLATAVVLVGCSPGGAPAGSGSPLTSPEDASGSRVAKKLTIALEGEPGNLDSRMEGGGLSPGGIQLAVQQRLSGYNDRGELIPQLAVRLPSQADGTWTVRPDGTMQTTYTIHRNVSWHDGAPLTTADFVFAWTIHSDKSLPTAQPIVTSLIDRIDTPDNFTLVIHWRESYPFANAITQEDLGPLPIHLLEGPYRAEKERFPLLPYWKREFVGVGPYRLVEWEPGSHITLRAYERFYMGPAKVDTIVFKFFPHAPTALASLLSGAVDGAIPRVLDFSQAMFVKNEWERAGRKPTLFVETTHWRFLSVQFREARANPPEVRDVQVRRGLLHAIDRKALADALLSGHSPVSDTFIPPEDPRWEWVKDVVVAYSYHPRRAHELLEWAGWRRTDDARATAAGHPAALGLWTTTGEQNLQEQAIVAEYWKAVGISVSQHVVPQALQRDREYRASYPAFDQTAIPLSFANTVFRAHSSQCPREPRWAGNNRGCYQDPVMDRVADALAVAIDEPQQRRLYRELVRLYSEDLPVLPLYFNVEATVFREGVVGVKGNTKPRTSHSWNIAEWDVL